MTLKGYHSQMTLYVGVVVGEMSADIEENTYERLKESLYVLQVDETMDTIGKCYLMGFVRFVQEEDISNQFLFLK